MRRLRALVLRCTGGRGIALGNNVFLPDDCCDSLPVLAHEVTHCGQYQAWGAFRYYARAIADRVRELRHRRGRGTSPYEYALDAVKRVRRVWDGAAGTDRGGLVSGLRPGPPAGHGGGSRSSQRANTFPSGSAISAMMPQACWVGSLRKRTPRWRSRPQ